jgi:hypothetical protein
VQDIRPLEARRYWWMRVEKLSDTKYALHDGMWSWRGNSAEAHDLQPVIWERKEDGDYITIRNCPNDGYSVTRYNFLARYLPRGLAFHFINDGKHYVKDEKGVDHYLPKFKCKWSYDASGVQYFEMLEDNKLVFKQTEHGFERMNGLQPMKTKRIDKELTKRYDLKLADMFSWMQAVLPVLGNTLENYEVRNRYCKALNEHAGFWYWTRYMNSIEVREILDDPEHDKRMPFAVMCAWESGMFDQTSYLFNPTKEGYSKLKQLIRKIGDMYTVELR